jgi:hypothetical protein
LPLVGRRRRVVGEPPATLDPEAPLRAAIPAVEAYHVDNGTYAGMTVRVLRERYDPALGDVRVVVLEGGARYCVETPPRASWAHVVGPGGQFEPGPCSLRGRSQPLLSQAVRGLHAAVRGMDAYWIRHGTYEGVTVRDLRRFLPGPRPLRIVEAGRDSFCLESDEQGETYSARESGDVGVGRC